MRVLLALLLIALTPAVAEARMPAPPALTIHHAPCPGVGGSCSDTVSDQIWLADESDRDHETAHQFDRQMLTEPRRNYLKHLLGYQPETPWDNGTGEGCGSECPDEVFADAYAQCNKPTRSRRTHGMVVRTTETSYGYYPTGRQHFRVCNAISIYGWLYYQSAAELQSTR